MKHKRRFYPIVYTFESGHNWEDQARRMFNGIRDTPFLRTLYQYGHHTFLPKTDCYGAQAADIAAWASVRIRVGGSTKSIDAFMPALMRLVDRFDAKNDAMVRFLRGQSLKDFIAEQKAHPSVPIEIGTAKRTFR
jgi:hypothetical protein